MWLGMSCVCVCEREKRERERAGVREKMKKLALSLIYLLSWSCTISSLPCLLLLMLACDAALEFVLMKWKLVQVSYAYVWLSSPGLFLERLPFSRKFAPHNLKSGRM